MFSIGLIIPEDFEVESLSGQDVSHWDDVGEQPHRVLVHFEKQIQGERELQLVLARGGKGIQKSIQVPRVSVERALKHTGTLLVSGERGVRLFTASRDGVSEVNPRELGATGTGYLGFRILRPDWAVELETDVLEPVVKADVVQQVQIGHGMLQAHCFVQYEIDNAGLKTLQFRAPNPGTALTSVAAISPRRVRWIWTPGYGRSTWMPKSRISTSWKCATGSPRKQGPAPPPMSCRCGP